TRPGQSERKRCARSKVTHHSRLSSVSLMSPAPSRANVGSPASSIWQKKSSALVFRATVVISRTERRPMNTSLHATAQTARRRIGFRILPFVFLMYVICYVDRANVSFANLRMSRDLGFTDTIYGFGVGMFFIGYV